MYLCNAFALPEFESIIIFDLMITLPFTFLYGIIPKLLITKLHLVDKKRKREREVERDRENGGGKKQGMC